MKIGGANSPMIKTEVVVLTADLDFASQARETFGASDQITLRLVSGALVVVDLDTSRPEEMQALDRLMTRIGSWPPVVVITQAFDESVARTLLQMRVADFLVKPVPPVELVRTCARVAKSVSQQEATEAQIFTFLPAVGGAGVTTLAGGDDAAQQRSARQVIHLPGRSRFPARLLR